MAAFLNISGLKRAFLAPIFKKEMESELSHIIEFSEKIVALGGIPTIETLPFPSDNWLQNAITLEQDVLVIYHDVYAAAEDYAKEWNDKSIVLLLEENIEHTTKDMEELKKLTTT
jgi:bacterioferritin (cytochrome b1)